MGRCWVSHCVSQQADDARPTFVQQWCRLVEERAVVGLAGAKEYARRWVQVRLRPELEEVGNVLHQRHLVVPPNARASAARAAATRVVARALGSALLASSGVSEGTAWGVKSVDCMCARLDVPCLLPVEALVDHGTAILEHGASKVATAEQQHHPHVCGFHDQQVGYSGRVAITERLGILQCVTPHCDLVLPCCS